MKLTPIPIKYLTMNPPAKQEQVASYPNSRVVMDDGMSKGIERQTPEERQADLKQFGEELKEFDPLTIATALNIGSQFREKQQFYHLNKLS